MAAIAELMTEMYAAFNRRDVDAALAHMTNSVSWPKASEGGEVSGKDEIRAYWTRQWQEYDPHVEPLEVLETAPDRVDVRVRQVVKSLGGEVLFEGEVWHFYTLREGRIERMELEGDGAVSAAFRRH